MKIRTLIVDDMKYARGHLRQALTPHPEFEIVAECDGGRSAIASIRQLRPDLVFLDVQMPRVNGFEVVEAIGAEEMPMVVFVTAYDQFAVNAFDVAALDYLLKPFDDERLARATERVKQRMHQAKSDLMGLVNLLSRVKNGQYSPRLSVKVGQRTVVLLVEDIDWIQTAGNYLELHLGRQMYLIREALNTFQHRLDPEHFIRIHRCTIVNIERIAALEPMYNGDQIVVLKSGMKLNASRTYAEAISRAIS